MRILLIHNYYQSRGGEDVVFEAERQMLEDNGHNVVVYTRHNNEIEPDTILSKINLFLSTIWASKSYRDIRRLAREFQPDIVHIHNTFPLISPSVYYAVTGFPVVQRLPNFRLLCLNATLFRDGKVCEACLDKAVPWPGVWFKCYHDSTLQSFAVASMITVHNLLSTWKRKVTVYLPPSEFVRQEFIELGWPAEQIISKPNFVIHEAGKQATGHGKYALYVGRLSPEKGVSTLLDAWRQLPDIPLRVVGTGPEQKALEDYVQKHNMTHVDMLGFRERKEIFELLTKAAFLVFPSEWYETFGITIAEAYACGVPVLASNIGAMQTTVIPGETGYHFEPGNVQDLAAKARQFWADPDELSRMRDSARNVYDVHYTKETNYRLLLNIYESIIG